MLIIKKMARGDAKNAVVPRSFFLENQKKEENWNSICKYCVNQTIGYFCEKLDN